MVIVRKAARAAVLALVGTLTSVALAFAFACAGCTHLSKESEKVPTGQPITEAQIKQVVAPATAFSEEQIMVIDYESFGDWAAAHVAAEGLETALAIFKREGPDWTLYDLGTGLVPDDFGSEVPRTLVEWAFP